MSDARYCRRLHKLFSFSWFPAMGVNLSFVESFGERWTLGGADEFFGRHRYGEI
jgi:hypothetical protein